MSTTHTKPVKSGEEKTDAQSPSFFPRVIREFDDEPHEEPMFYGGD